MTTPIERAGNALMRNRAYQAGVAFGVPDETEAEAKHRSEIIKAVLDSIDTEELARVAREHRRNRAVNFGRDYACLCGTILRSNSHHAQAEHQAQAIKDHLTGKENQ